MRERERERFVFACVYVKVMMWQKEMFLAKSEERFNLFL